MFAIALSFILASIFIVLLVLILVIFIIAIILHLCYYITIDCWTINFFSYKTIVHLNSYLEELRGVVLELLIRNPTSLLVFVDHFICLLKLLHPVLD